MRYSAEEFSRAGDQFLGRSYDEMDCQSLVERMMAAVGYKRDLGGSNSWYRECMKDGWAGTPEECVRTVTAKSGSTVKLRQKPSMDCTIYWNIPVGTEMEIVDQRENWSKCICGGLTGWMKNEFIRTGGEEDLPIAPEPSVSEDKLVIMAVFDIMLTDSQGSMKQYDGLN